MNSKKLVRRGRIDRTTREIIMKSFIISIITVIITSMTVLAQYDEPMKGSEWCSLRKRHLPAVQVPRGPHSPQHSYDILSYTLNLDLYNNFISPFPKSYIASNIVHFRVDTTLNTIKLNAVNTSLDIDSVTLAGLSFAHIHDTLTIVLDRTYYPGEEAEVEIYYHHKNVSDDAVYVSNGFFFTDTEPQGARKWFPCWDHPSDKATLDLTARTPVNVRLGSNGRLADSLNTGEEIYYHWISRDPIATYLDVISAKVNYQLDILYWPLPSNPDSIVPIRFYYNLGENPEPAENIIMDMTDFYSQLFGLYPFEKGGFAALNNQFIWGGMENQTLINICPNCWGYESLIAHEYSHQWFGDMITCGTWADLWLNEGFATYIEALWIEHLNGYNAYKNEIDSDASSYLDSNPGWPISDPAWAFNPPDNDILFNYAITYLKGACVLHMFRYVLGDDMFFNVLHEYAADTVNFKYKTAVTQDFVAKVNEVTNDDYSWFFNEWIYQPDHPIYQNTYNFQDEGGGSWQVNFRARQVQTTAPFFKMPLEIKIIFTDQSDTVLRVMNDSNLQWFSFTFNKQPGQLIFDPDNEIVLKVSSTVMGEGDQNKADPFMVWQNSPNPFSQTTTIDYQLPVKEHVVITLFDISGKTMSVLCDEDQDRGRHTIVFHDDELAPGMYYCRVSAGNASRTLKMVVIK
jgi:aminopeptidase N